MVFLREVTIFRYIYRYLRKLRSKVRSRLTSESPKGLVQKVCTLILLLDMHVLNSIFNYIGYNHIRVSAITNDSSWNFGTFFDYSAQFKYRYDKFHNLSY
jgi:hypothetical protein